MSDHHDWESWLSTLDEVRPTPPDVKWRIRQRALTSGGGQGPEAREMRDARSGADWPQGFEPDAGLDPTPLELIPTGPEEGTGSGRWLRAAVAVAATLLVGIAVWLGWPNQPESDVAASAFPNRSSELACLELRFVSDDLDFLASDGPTLTVDQLNGLSTAFAVFVEELEAIGFSDSEALTVWRDASASLRQAAIFASSGNAEASVSLVDQARDNVFNLVWNTDHRVVETCFDGWVN